MKKIVLIASIFFITTSVTAEILSETKRLSGTPRDITESIKNWDGSLLIPTAYCGKIPNPQNTTKRTIGIYGENRNIFMERLSYKENILLTIVIGNLSKGFSAEEDHKNTLAVQLNSRKKTLAQAPHAVIEVSEDTGNRWPTVGLRYNNVVSDTPEVGPFPLVKQIGFNFEPSFNSMAVHRMFSRGRFRYEIAAMQPAPEPITDTSEREMKERLTSIVDATTQSLQECTEKMLGNTQ